MFWDWRPATKADIDQLRAAMEEELRAMSAEMERMRTEVRESRTAIDGMRAALRNIAGQIRENAEDKQALIEMADELDAQQADIAADMAAGTAAAGETPET